MAEGNTSNHGQQDEETDKRENLPRHLPPPQLFLQPAGPVPTDFFQTLITSDRAFKLHDQPSFAHSLSHARVGVAFVVKRLIGQLCLGLGFR